LHLLHHTQQERFTFTRGTAFFSCFLLPRYGRLLAGLCRFKLTTQQVTLHTQQVTLLLHSEERLYFWGEARVLRVTGARCCILERSSLPLLRVPPERVA
jgi:hypothetical protein